jgi:ketosteroid isomerase-like protein
MEKFMSKDNEIRNASEQFYAALNRLVNGDADPLADIWSHSAAVTALQLIGGRQVGWDEVRESWEKLAQMISEGRIKLGGQFIQVAGDVAYELGIEQFSLTLAGHSVLGEHRVTNIYRREAGGWKVVHHHTDLSPAMLSVLSRLLE